MNKYHLKCSKYINYLPTYLPNDDGYIFLLKQTGQVDTIKEKKLYLLITKCISLCVFTNNKLRKKKKGKIYL